MIVFAKAGSDESAMICGFVARELGNSGWDSAKCAAMAVIRDGKLSGGVVFHDWNPDAQVICMSAAGGRGWLSLDAIYQMHRYCFDDAGAQLSVLQVSEHNSLMRRTAEKFGYSGVTVPRLRGRNEDEVIYTLPEEVWRSHPLTKRAEKRAII
ncbi:GNAT family N-acetyltransferase [Celeribacter naphthalenivorans]|uniref:GNAT family N-acetyltransferase n=1 Tax=Celeribacter naphthalenivorans TaxID=1614694 RepID=UPI001CFA2C91|nr:GNAT family protein [Celeribacter naphthalenivorans]